ncbi:DUF7122 family protein [Halomarina ordinaria]|uniref:DUF7122 domain-containing protein n=1 Tax=Halomarina ordinaria TaxID=3033939 RepID=A0ABD5U7H2_9EURY|nr:hypothetical protein [Halomarina sp. PSRA2]
MSDHRENVSHRFDRVPETAADREVEGRPSRAAVLDFWEERFGVPRDVFEGYSFWEKGSGKLWAFAGDVSAPTEVEALGMTFLRVRQEHWKPTTDAAQRFGPHATKNVVHLEEDLARRFVAGETVDPEWDGDWGYLVVTHDLAGNPAPLGVGLYLYDELRSQIPKGRRRAID